MLLKEKTDSHLKYMETPWLEIPQQNRMDSHVKVGLLNLIVRKWELRLRSLIHVIAETEHHITF